MMQKLKLFLLCGMLCSCKTAATLPSVIPSNNITDFPVKPTLVQYKIPPVIKKVETNYLVTGDMVNNSVLLTDYYKRLEVWKEGRGIR